VGVTERRIPRWRDLAPLLRRKPWVLNGTRRRLAAAATIPELRAIARRRTPRAVFDYTDGGADDEISMARARDAFGRVEFRPNVLRDVSTVDPSTSVLGKPSALPIVFGPTGFTRMMHHEGEIAVARAAAAAGIPYALSTMGTTSAAALACAVGDVRRWFQLYLWRDRARSMDLIRAAGESGYEALVLTVDTPVAGPRLRDVRNGLTIPPALTLRTFLNGAVRPWWWWNLLTTRPLEFASFSSWNGTAAELANHMFDPSASIRDVAWLREIWPGKLIVKGVQHVDDARAVVATGADAIVISNHGGRQLDRSPVPLEQLPSIAECSPARTPSRPCASAPPPSSWAAPTSTASWPAANAAYTGWSTYCPPRSARQCNCWVRDPPRTSPRTWHDCARTETTTSGEVCSRPATSPRCDDRRALRAGGLGVPAQGCSTVSRRAISVNAASR
jgi:L-lactate dehydrogenase (cytochrome)